MDPEEKQKKKKRMDGILARAQGILAGLDLTQPMRHYFTKEEKRELDKLAAEFDELAEELGITKNRASELFDKSCKIQPLRPNPTDGGLLGGNSWEPSLPGLAQGRQESNPRSYRSLFCSKPDSPPLDRGGWASFGEFARAIQHKLSDERIQRSLQEGIGSDGGFSVPTAFAAEVFDVALEQEIVRPRALIVPMKTDEKKIPATTIGDHSSNLYGGVISYWESEGSTLTQAEPTFRSLKLKAKKLTCYGIATAEWEEDVPGSVSMIDKTFANAIGFYLDKAFLKGSGAGQPLGILNSPCLIAVAEEGGQDADTINYPNLCNMLARLHPASYANSIWVAHTSTIPQLLQLSHIVGTAGSLVPALKDAGRGTWTLLTRPVVFTEKLEPLGDQGDILLADMSQYAIGMRRELRFDVSIHVKFASDQVAYRAIARIDGQPLWDEALTLEDGSTTVSPFVTLVERT